MGNVVGGIRAAVKDRPVATTDLLSMRLQPGLGVSANASSGKVEVMALHLSIPRNFRAASSDNIGGWSGEEPTPKEEQDHVWTA